MKIKDILILTMVKGIGPSTIKKNLLRLKTDSDYTDLVKSLKPEELKNCATYEKEAENILDICKKETIDVIDITSDLYPQPLKEISNPPAILYIKGNSKLLDKIIIAIVGTRHSTNLGNRIAEKLGEFFSKQYAICNGLVEGIDEHSVCINGNVSQNVIGVVSGGLCYHKTCSKNHTRIIDNVLDAGGLIISEYPPMVKEDQYSGANSSRIQAGISTGIILVQSKYNGGSKYTLETFSKLNRILGVIHYPNSAEYQNEEFAANRLIIEKRLEGLSSFIGVKNNKKINVQRIIPIESKQDYFIFEKYLSNNQSYIFDKVD